MLISSHFSYYEFIFQLFLAYSMNVRLQDMIVLVIMIEYFDGVTSSCRIISYLCSNMTEYTSGYYGDGCGET